MGRVLRVVGFVGLTFVALAAASVGYLYSAFPRVGPAPTMHVEQSEQKRARGTYLAEHVTLCIDCHSERDFSRFSGPPAPGSFGKGGERFGHELGLPGELYAPNITPYALGSWSDGEIVRAITSGVTPAGRALFPLMNYPAYAKLCRDDLASLVTYLRGLAPIEHTPPSTELDFPVNLIVRTLPEPAELAEPCPDPNDSVAQGGYLVGVAGCADCHSPRKGEAFGPELAFAGGVELPLPNGHKVLSKNLTPDVASGIGSWSRATFINRFAAYRKAENVARVDDGDFNTLMPWSMYAGMTDEDLGAIYDFLRTQKPVKSGGPKVAAR